MPGYNKLDLFNATVNIEIDSDISEKKLSSLFSDVLHVFGQVFFEGGFTGVDSSALNVKRLTLDVSLIDDEMMTELNHKYRGKMKTTDVLSFPVHDDMRTGIDSSSIISGELILGDIFISIPVALKQSQESGITIETELVELFIHGVLHLMGYDHEISKSEEETMYKLEEKIFDLYKEKK